MYDNWDLHQCIFEVSTYTHTQSKTHTQTHKHRCTHADLIVRAIEWFANLDKDIFFLGGRFNKNDARDNKNEL